MDSDLKSSMKDFFKGILKTEPWMDIDDIAERIYNDDEMVDRVFYEFGDEQEAFNECLAEVVNELNKESELEQKRAKLEEKRANEEKEFRSWARFVVKNKRDYHGILDFYGEECYKQEYNKDIDGKQVTVYDYLLTHKISDKKELLYLTYVNEYGRHFFASEILKNVDQKLLEDESIVDIILDGYVVGMENLAEGVKYVENGGLDIDLEGIENGNEWCFKNWLSTGEKTIPDNKVIELLDELSEDNYDLVYDYLTKDMIKSYIREGKEIPYFIFGVIEYEEDRLRKEVELEKLQEEDKKCDEALEIVEKLDKEQSQENEQEGQAQGE